MSDSASCASERSALRAAPTLARGGVWGVQSAAIGSRAQTNGSESLRLVVAALAAARSSLRSACEDLDCRTGSHSVGSGGLLLPATCLARCPELSSASSSPPNRGRPSGSRRSRGLHPERSSGQARALGVQTARCGRLPASIWPRAAGALLPPCRPRPCSARPCKRGSSRPTRSGWRSAGSPQCGPCCAAG